MKTINYETIKSNLMVALENTGTDCDWKEEWNNKGYLNLSEESDDKALYYCEYDDKIHELQLKEYKEHFYPGTDCVDWSEYMFEDSEVAVYYCSKNNEIYECNVGDTIADQHA